ncbi:RidA family protein [Roseomonas hellenica]|uniref:RidA family protein n=1 Tax=Plastoroseomonas hellenica TaxID=2687306 RepID=A0ABS5F3G4_9PROT|nr:RidA family protein [Plastoroseomonas hellenica]MBR0667063.1 RidA family protein [Plastoroseomonas hellenica]
MPQRPPFRLSPTNNRLGEIQTQPERQADMPYAPAIRVRGGGDLLYVSGATPSPLYHHHPHRPEEHDHPVRIEDQATRVFDTLGAILAHEGLAWTDVVKVTRYLTDMRDQDGLNAVQGRYFESWRPVSTTVCINQLSTPGARVEVDLVAAYRPD